MRAHQPSLRKGQEGVAILILVTIILLAISSLLINQLSLNQRAAERTETSLRTLNQGKQALIGYALQHATPGTLPCPDTTGDGLENPQGANCQAQLGLVPHRTLNLPELNDANGARLWYAVDLNYTDNAATVKNSSLATTLSLDGITASAVLIAPGPAVETQSRRLLNRTDHLEGLNADANFNSFESTQSLTQNDRVIALDPGRFWTIIERRALGTANQLLTDYRALCGEYPFAAAFGGPFTSIVNSQFGAVPLASAQPNEWGTACGLGNAPTPPAWLTNNWADQLLYRMCLVAEGTCVTVLANVATTTTGVVIGPGVTLAGQVRPDTDVGDYFEDENNNLPDNQFRSFTLREHDSTYNDQTQVIGP